MRLLWTAVKMMIGTGFWVLNVTTSTIARDGWVSQNVARADSSRQDPEAVVFAEQHPDSLAVPHYDHDAPLPEPAFPEQPSGVSWPADMKPFDYSRLDPEDFILTAVRITEPVKLDGRLTEEVWQQAAPATHFYQLEPSEGYPASQPTEVRVLYDDKNLYIGFMCYDAEPDRIMAPDMRRDTRMSFSNDMVQVVIAPLEGGREAYEFQVNPNGARTDMFVSKEGASQDQNWNGNWNAAAARHDQGWSVEYMIPFYELRFPANEEQTWSINFGRRIQRLREDSYWVPLRRKDGDRGLYKFQKGGRLTGLHNLKPGGNIQVIPYTVIGSEGTRNMTVNPGPVNPVALTDMRYGFERNAGGDLKWSITSGLTLNATANPDFAQVEADDQVVNLSRFEFRFDEKRPFFLERSDIFSLGRSGRGGRPQGGGGNVPELFFSRRIGRQLPDGSNVPIDLGLRFTGKIGGTTIGYLNVQTPETSYKDDDTVKTEPVTNWQALRLSQDMGSRSNVGLLATFKEPNPALNDNIGMAIPRFSEANYNRVVGLDATLAAQNTQHELSAMFAQSWTDTLQDKDEQRMWRVAHTWQNRWLQFNSSFMEIGDHFIAQTGFVRQTGIRRFGNRTQFSPFIRKYGIRRIRSSVSMEYLTDLDDGFSNPETWRVNPFIMFEMEAGVWIAPGWSRTFDTLSKKSQIAGVHFNKGAYTYDQADVFMFTDPGKRLGLGNARLQIGEFYGGDLISFSGEVRYKPTNRLAFEPGITWTRLKRDDRIGLNPDEFDFNNRLIPRFRFNYSFSPNLTVNSFVQFNADKRRPEDAFHLNTVTMNFLIAYRSPFGHSFFFAVNQFYDDALDTVDSFDPFNRTPLRLRDQTVVAKIAYLFNL